MSDKMKYEPPKLIEFNDQIEPSKGICSPGSGDTGVCDGSGLSAAGGCWASGFTAVGGCNATGSLG